MLISNYFVRITTLKSDLKINYFHFLILEYWREIQFEEVGNGVEQFLRPSDHLNRVLKMFVKSSKNQQQQEQQQQQKQ